MGREIERRFRVVSDAWREKAERPRPIRQGCLVAEDARSVWIRLDGEEARLVLEGAARGPEEARPAWEVPLPAAEAREILEALCGGRVVERTRHAVPEGDVVFQVDEFSGANAGLVLAEVAPDRPDRELPSPAWLGEEVTGDPRFVDAGLAKHPFATWGGEGGGEEDALAAAIARSAVAARTSSG